MLKPLIELLFPKECINCNNIGEYICKKCLQNIKFHPDICPFCGKYSLNFKVCKECKDYKEIYVNGILISTEYDGLIKKLILKLKYGHKKDISNFFINKIKLNIMSNDIINYIMENNKVLITSIPSHWIRKYIVKGYNQSELLASKLSKILDLKYSIICKKTRHSKSQIKLNKKNRLINLQNAFKIKKNININNYDYIFIIDDITTTGTTINEVAKTIKGKYPKIEIWGIVIGRHGS